VSKRIALKDFIEVDAVDLSEFAHSVDFESTHARVDVSGFNLTGANEWLAGTTDQKMTIGFYGSYGTTEVHATLYPAHVSRAIVTLKWRPDASAAVSATNPQLEGNVQIYTYGPKAKRGDVEQFDVEFSAADAAGLVFVTADAG
jgi:hypothetical protein